MLSVNMINVNFLITCKILVDIFCMYGGVPGFQILTGMDHGD